jgi:predicted amidohydrolase
VKVSLAVPALTGDSKSNLAAVLAMVSEAGRERSDVVVFPEASLTGFTINDDPTHDLALGETIPGPATERIGRAAREAGIWIAIGMFERDGSTLYDSALLLTSDGEIALRYRRISPGWHAGDADPGFYGRGDGISSCETPFGRSAILICGDMFDETLVRKTRELHADCVFVPMARSFDDGSTDTERWNRDEKRVYIKQVGRLGTRTFVVNCLCLTEQDRSFGGALAIASDGSLIDSLPIGQPGFLTVEA